MARIVVDPITRIEGHLRIEATLEGGVIRDACSSGTMVRGLEKILKGCDPRDAWAFTERACGVCTTVHALASVRCVEDALGITGPPNAELVRNLMFCAQYLQDHVVHFYHLHALDWVDIVSALSADPKATADLAATLSGERPHVALHIRRQLRVVECDRIDVRSGMQLREAATDDGCVQVGLGQGALNFGECSVKTLPFIVKNCGPKAVPQLDRVCTLLRDRGGRFLTA